jgi:hypothetical protein
LSGIFDSIIAAAGAVGEKVGDAITVALDGAHAALAALGGDRGVERIYGQLDAMAENGWSGDFVQGQALTEALEAQQVSLETYRGALASVVAEGGQFAEVAQQMIDASGQLDTFTMPAPVVPQGTEIDMISGKLEIIRAVAAETLSAVQAVLADILAATKAVDMTSEGARITQSIANGMLSQLGAVRTAANQISATIRNALPGNARVNVALSGVPTAPVQARAKGGSFRPGWLMTGEEGPELEYRTEGGFIAHNRALRGMIEMASRARNIAQGITLGNGGFGGGLVPAMATVAASGGGSQRQAITYAPQYNMPLSFAPGVDMAEVRATVRAELMNAEERAMAAMRGLLHD